MAAGRQTAGNSVIGRRDRVQAVVYACEHGVVRPQSRS